MEEPSKKQGRVKECPNCGATWVSGTVKCKECGYILTEVAANQNATLLDERLRDAAPSERSEVVKSFPIPHSREDIIEFLAALEPKTHELTRHPDKYEKAEHMAYVEKFKECLNKADMLYPDDPVIKKFVEKVAEKKKKKLIVTCSVIGVAIIAFILFFSWVSGLEKDEKQAGQEYVEQVNARCTELCAEIDDLPDPTPENYKECIRKFESITWDNTTSWKGDGSRPSTWELEEQYAKKKAGYAKQIGMAMKEAGIDEDDIPSEYSYPTNMEFMP